jgi:hypothetical protein
MLVYVATSPGPPPNQQLRVASTVVTQAEQKFRGEPTNGPPDIRGAKLLRTYETVQTLTEAESYYHLPNGVILCLKLKAQKARRFSSFVPEGDPLIQLEHVTEVSTVAGEGVPPPARLELGIPGTTPPGAVDQT